MSVEFLVTSLIIVASPGTGVLYTLAAGLSRGSRPSVVAAFGCTIGIVPHMAAAIMGLSALLHASALAFQTFKYLGVAYLLYLAWKMWRAPVAAAERGLPGESSPARMFFAGMAVTLGNPKIMVFYLALVPTIIDLSHVSAIAWAELAATMVAVLVAVDLAWVLAAARARRLLTSARAVRVANRASATLIAGAAVAIARQ